MQNHKGKCFGLWTCQHIKHGESHISHVMNQPLLVLIIGEREINTTLVSGSSGRVRIRQELAPLSGYGANCWTRSWHRAMRGRLKRVLQLDRA